MRRACATIIVALLLLAVSGCSQAPTTPTTPAPVTYDPATFRADVDRQLAADGDGGGYMAIGLDMILLPGVYPRIEYDRSRDWYVPGTQDAIQDSEWQHVATEFAERYNLRRRGMKG